MRTPLKLYTFIPRKHSASFYYRLEVPVRTANDLGLPVLGMIDTNDSEISPQQRIEAFCEADVSIMYQPVGEGNITNIKGVQSFIPAKRGDGWKWPPTVIVDTDDNLFDVNPLNPAYRNLGTRDGDGNPLPLGHHIGVVKNGEKKVLYADGQDGFSIKENRARIDSYRHILNMADCVTCSSKEVEKYVRRESIPRRTKVFPNLVRMDHYEQVSLAPSKKIRILWQGGDSHHEDLYPLRKAMGNITKKYPEVEWVIWGALFPWLVDYIPADRYRFVSWCAYQEYRLRMSMIGHDINLAPLRETRFSLCKSAIKWYESSVLMKPAATLASRVTPYKDEIIDGSTALLFDGPKDFEEKLSLLIEDAGLRQQLGANAKDWVSENRDAFKFVPAMIRYYEELREERKIEQPHVTDEEWEEIVAQMKEADEKEEAEKEEKDNGALQPVD